MIGEFGWLDRHEEKRAFAHIVDFFKKSESMDEKSSEK